MVVVCDIGNGRGGGDLPGRRGVLHHHRSMLSPSLLRLTEPRTPTERCLGPGIGLVECAQLLLAQVVVCLASPQLVFCEVMESDREEASNQMLSVTSSFTRLPTHLPHGHTSITDLACKPSQADGVRVPVAGARTKQGQRFWLDRPQRRRRPAKASRPSHRLPPPSPPTHKSTGMPSARLTRSRAHSPSVEREGGGGGGGTRSRGAPRTTEERQASSSPARPAPVGRAPQSPASSTSSSARMRTRRELGRTGGGVRTDGGCSSSSSSSSR